MKKKGFQQTSKSILFLWFRDMQVTLLLQLSQVIRDNKIHSYYIHFKQIQTS